MQRDNISLRQNMEKIKEKINNKVEDLHSKKDIIKRYNEIKNLKKKKIFNHLKQGKKIKILLKKKSLKIKDVFILTDLKLELYTLIKLIH